MLIIIFSQIDPNQEPRNKVLSLSLVKCLVGFHLPTLIFMLYPTRSFPIVKKEKYMRLAEKASFEIMDSFKVSIAEW